MKLFPLTGITAILLTTVIGEKWDFMKDGDRKKFEKKKEFRNVEEYKKETYEKYDKYDIKKYKNEYPEPTTEKFLKNEKDQLCQSLEEDNVKNSLLKFGLITHLIENVNKFKKSMKTLSTAGQKVGLKQKTDKSAKTRINTRTNTRTDKELIKQKGGTNVKLQQSNFVGRSLKLLSPLKMFYDDERSNFIEEQVDRRKRDTRGRKGTLKIPLGQVPKCYGWKYLKTLDALIDDTTVDTDYLSQSMSEMLDMKFSSSVSEIFDDCEDALLTPFKMCPQLQYPEEADSPKCPDKCSPDNLTSESLDCAYGEICCKAVCGGFKCIKPEGKNKPEKSEKCSVGDKFMQCVYQKIDTQICSDG